MESKSTIEKMQYFGNSSIEVYTFFQRKLEV